MRCLTGNHAYEECHDQGTIMSSCDVAAASPFLRVPSPIRRSGSVRSGIDSALNDELALEQLRQRDSKRKKGVLYASDSSTPPPRSK